jgi:predicted small lipoprotein YifL
MPGRLVWPLFTLLMGFALGGSFARGILYVPPEQYTAHNQQTDKAPAKEEHKNDFSEKGG